MSIGYEYNYFVEVQKEMTSLTTQKTQPKITFLVGYQCFLAVAAILVFFTKLDGYLEGRGIGLPLWWMIAFIGLSFPLWINLPKNLNRIPSPILFWCAGYLALPLISILILPQIPDLQYLENHIRSAIFLLLMLAIFSYHPIGLKCAKVTIFVVTFLNVGMLVYEFFNPTAFYLQQHAPGRAAGFYHDSNTAIIVLIFGMIFAIDLIKPKYRLFYVLFTFLGIAATFSRGGMVGWVFVLIIFLATKIIPRHQIYILFLSSFVFISILSNQLNNLGNIKTADGTYLFNEGSIARVEFLLNPLGQQDSSQAGRLNHVEKSWKKFSRQPFVGNGLGAGANEGSISAKGTAQRSHNIYLDAMTEYGFLGALVFPLLIAACAWKAEGEFKKQAIAFTFFALIQGFFTHTIMSEFCLLTTYAVMVNLTHQSRLENIQS